MPPCLRPCKVVLRQLCQGAAVLQFQGRMDARTLSFDRKYPRCLSRCSYDLMRELQLGITFSIAQAGVVSLTCRRQVKEWAGGTFAAH